MNSNVQITDFDKICRLCMIRLTIHKELIETETLKMIKACTAVLIEATDKLPSYICEACSIKLHEYFYFQKSCEEIDQRLRKMLKEFEKINVEINGNDSENEGSKYVDIDKSDEDRANNDLVKNSALYQCDTCEATFKKVWALGHHMGRVHDAKGDRCTKCDAVYYHPLHLSAHQKNHDEKRYKCNTCNKSFIHKKQFESHQVTHTTEKPFKCDICGKYFKRNFILKQHIVYMHSDVQKYIACPICGKSVIKWNLNQHLKIHSERSTITCSQCAKSFFHQQSLMQHIRRVHQNETREYKLLCSTCGQGVASQAELIRHLRSHTDEKPYHCDQCKNCYKTPKALKSHVNSAHLDVRPFNCTVCSRAFHTKNILANHMRIHTGERPFQCVVCDKSFGTKSVLKTHMKVHNTEK